MSADGTPDLAAVVARVREAAEGMELMQVEKYTRLAADLRALLAAVSRPAEARGEPAKEVRGEWFGIAIDGEPDATLAVRSRAAAERYITRFHADCAVAVIEPFRAHPAPSGGEGHWQAYLRETGQHLPAPRPEPGEPSEAMVEALATSLWNQHVENVKAVHGRWKAWDKMREDDKQAQRDKARKHLRAALAAQRVTP